MDNVIIILAVVREELEKLRKFTRSEWAHPEEDKKEPPEEKQV